MTMTQPIPFSRPPAISHRREARFPLKAASPVVGEVVHPPGTRTDYSFSVANAHRAWLLTLTYRSAGEAELARSVIAALLPQATEIIAHPVRSYSVDC
jgi:hypothetical protein